jgi:protein arginine kinase activator
MKCQMCENPASVHVTDLAAGKKRELHLCDGCAKARGLVPQQPGGQLNLKALLSLLTGGALGGGKSDKKAKRAETCAVCGLTLAEFKAHGRFGCEHDYEALRVAIEPLLERVHRYTAHCGKVPRPQRVQVWKQQMQEAIDAENYEEAARLRDLIRGGES